MPPLPLLPYEFQRFIDNPHLSSLSRILCLIFSFASLECTAEFPSFRGPPGFFAIHSHIYHRVRPTHHNSAVHWLLYDGFLPDCAPYQNWASLLPPSWVQAVTHALFRVNPFVRSLHQLSFVQPSAFPEANVIIEDQGSCPEVCLFILPSFSLISFLFSDFHPFIDCRYHVLYQYSSLSNTESVHCHCTREWTYSMCSGNESFVGTSCLSSILSLGVSWLGGYTCTCTPFI